MRHYLIIVLLFFLPMALFAQSNTDSSLVIPNVFTPNDDAVNDVFQIKSDSLISLKVGFYSRWGIKVAEMNGVNDHWDGRTSSGEEVPDGIYFYIMEAEDRNGGKINKTGHVTLLR